MKPGGKCSQEQMLETATDPGMHRATDSEVTFARLKEVWFEMVLSDKVHSDTVCDSTNNMTSRSREKHRAALQICCWAVVEGSPPLPPPCALIGSLSR